MNNQTWYYLAVIVLLAALLGFGGGWGARGCTITPHTDTVRVEVPVRLGDSFLGESAPVKPIIKYVEDSSRVDSLMEVITRLLAEASTGGTEIVAMLDTVLTRYEVLPETTYALSDTFHVEYVYPPVSIFRNITLRHSPFEVRRDTVLQWDEVTGFQIFRDGKYIVLGAVGTLAVIKLVEIIKQ